MRRLIQQPQTVLDIEDGPPCLVAMHRSSEYFRFEVRTMYANLVASCTTANMATVMETRRHIILRHHRQSANPLRAYQAQVADASNYARKIRAGSSRAKSCRDVINAGFCVFGGDVARCHGVDAAKGNERPSTWRRQQSQ